MISYITKEQDQLCCSAGASPGTAPPSPPKLLGDVQVEGRGPKFVPEKADCKAPSKLNLRRCHGTSLYNTTTNREQASRTLFLPCQVCPSPLGELQGSCQHPGSCRDPKKKKPSKSLGCRIINTLLHMRTAIYEWPGAQRAPTAPAPSRSPLGAWEQKRGPVVPRRRKMN